MARDAMNVFTDSTLARLAASGVLGVVVGIVVGLATGNALAALIGWIAGVVVFLGWTWAILHGMDGDATRTHSQREDPSRVVSEVLILVASVASLGGVGALLFGSHTEAATAKVVDGVVAIAAVGASWCLIHTLYLLRYARLFYAREAERIIDFNEPDGYEPCYSDFAYVAFDMGTTFQISDTSIHTPELRRVVMRQGLLGYVFGTFVLATAINLVVSLVG